MKDRIRKRLAPLADRSRRRVHRKDVVVHAALSNGTGFDLRCCDFARAEEWMLALASEGYTTSITWEVQP